MSAPTTKEELREWQEVYQVIERPLLACVTRAREMLTEMSLPVDEGGLIQVLHDKANPWHRSASASDRRRAVHLLQLLVWVRQTDQRLPKFDANSVLLAQAALNTGVIAANLGISNLKIAQSRRASVEGASRAGRRAARHDRLIWKLSDEYRGPDSTSARAEWIRRKLLQRSQKIVKSVSTIERRLNLRPK